MRAQADQTPIRDRVMNSALKYVDTVGLSLGITAEFVQHLSADAGVSARQFAQVWPSTDHFLADLCCEVADQARIDRADTQTLVTTWQYLSTRSGELHTPEGRRRVLRDVIRTAAEYNFEVVTASNKWRTYAAISTTIMSWPDGTSRNRITESLRASQMSFIETMESFYRNVLPTIGYRLQPVLDNDYQAFVVATAAVIEGLGVVRSTVPALVESHFTQEQDGTDDDWSLAALSFLGMVDTFIEPDPQFVPSIAIGRLNGGYDVTPELESGDRPGF